MNKNMNIKTLLKNNQSGEIILFVVFVMLFMVMFVGFFVSKLLIWQTKVALNAANSVQAYYIADSGAEATMYILTTSEDVPVALGDFKMPEFGAFEVSSESDCYAKVTEATASSLKMEVVGVYKGVASRAIQLSW
jgi:hypothetical protein